MIAYLFERNQRACGEKISLQLRFLRSLQQQLPRSFSCLFLALACLVATSCSRQELPAAPTVRLLATDMSFVEGPVWLTDQQTLVFSDIPAKRLMQWSETDGLAVFRQSPAPNGNALDSKGRLLSCRHDTRDIVRTESDGSLAVVVDRYRGARLNSPNDLAVHPDGSIWFTDPPWGLAEQKNGREIAWNGVYRFDPASGKMDLLLDHHSMPNGIALSSDASTLYLADTGGHPSHPDASKHDLPPVFTAYAIDASGSLIAEPLWTVATRCDGMAIDSAGLIYTTSPEGIVVISPEGEIVERIALPESPANCTFGGANGRTLFVTARTSLYAIEFGG